MNIEKSEISDKLPVLSKNLEKLPWKRHFWKVDFSKLKMKNTPRPLWRDVLEIFEKVEIIGTHAKKNKDKSSTQNLRKYSEIKNVQYFLAVHNWKKFNLI